MVKEEFLTVRWNNVLAIGLGLIFGIYAVVVWWLPVVLRVFGIMNYSTAFWTFFSITIFRATANLYRNNVLTPEQAECFPLRSP